MAETLTKLSETWNLCESMPFNEWVEAVATEVMLSGVGVVRSARLIDAQPAEVLAVLKLASLDSEDLAEFSNRVPPRTTWLTLADATRGEIIECLDALKKRPKGASPAKILDEHILINSEASEWEKVLELPASTLKHMYDKSVIYGCLGPKPSGALKNFARRKKNGQAFSLPQAQYLKDILIQLVDAGAVSRNTHDNDQLLCAQVIDALGKP
jgi:hypothetical protein